MLSAYLYSIYVSVFAITLLLIMFLFNKYKLKKLEELLKQDETEA